MTTVKVEAKTRLVNDFQIVLRISVFGILKAIHIFFCDTSEMIGRMFCSSKQHLFDNDVSNCDIHTFILQILFFCYTNGK